MKAALNGVLNVSVPDGWWAEAHDPAVGFTIGAQENPDAARDAALLYDVLEEQVVPVFFDRDGENLPRRWIAMMRASMSAFVSRFSTRRMLEDYERVLY